MIMRKDIKKSSYYVWFLGAQEAKGLRGSEYITPVIRSLVERERDVEPFKVTLQISHRGLKIVQNVPNAGNFSPTTAKSAGKKSEVVKHFIPHQAVTCVLQDEDIVACILLLYNPVTKCPVHVHAYRCDSVETATVLAGQLQALAQRPENQKKLAEIEAGLKQKGLLPPSPSERAPPPRRSARLPAGGGSDGRSNSTRESESSGGSSSERLSGVGRQERIASLYDSLAAELREKLGAGASRGPQGSSSSSPQGPHAPAVHAPILLPPRDYDTVHRQKGNLSNIDLRRCLNMNIVGVNASSSSSSPNIRPSPAGGGGKHTSGAKVGSSGGSSGIGSDHAPSPDQDPDARFLDNHSTSDEEWNTDPTTAKEQSLFLVQSNNWKGVDAVAAALELSLPRARKAAEPDPVGGHHAANRSVSHSSHLSLEPEPTQAAGGQRRRKKEAEERQRSPSPPPDTPRERFNDAKEKFLSLERERLDEERAHDRRRGPQQVPARASQAGGAEPPISPSVVPVLFQRSRPARSWSRSRDSEEDLEGRLTRGRFYQPEEEDVNVRYIEDRDPQAVVRRESLYRKVRSRDGLDSDDFHIRQQGRTGYLAQRLEESRRNNRMSPSDNKDYGMPEGLQERSTHHHSQQAHRSRYTSPSPPPNQGPVHTRDRPISPQPRPAPRAAYQEECRPPGRMPPGRGGGSNIPLERYRSPTRMPRPAPRHQRYPSPSGSDKKKSVYESVEEERRRSSNELAKEFKRRSYQELEDHERYPGLDRETAAVSRMQQQQQQQHEETPPRYRHSYAEYHNNINHELLHRTNSSVSSGRVGIAAIHPY